MAQRKQMTVRSIAEACGLSTATISRVLNNDPNVADATRKRVLKALEESGYEAPSVPEPRVHKIGVIIVSSQSDYFHAVLGQIGMFFRNLGVSTVAMNTEGMPGQLTNAMNTLYDSNIQGLIFVSCDYESIKEHLHSKIPHVWVDCNDLPAETAGICRVQSDHLVSGSMAAQALMEKGCSNPLVLTNAHVTHRGADRLRGFVAEFATKGILIDEDHMISLPGIKSEVTESQEMIRYLMTKGMEFDSIFAMTDSKAMGAYMGCMKMGLRIPEDVKLVGFDGVAPACTEVLNITSVQQNVPLLAQYAGEMLLKQIKKQPVEQKRIVVPTNLLPGQTT